MRGIMGELDGYLYSFPHRLFSTLAWKSGEIPLWNPYLLCGFPQLAAIATTALYLPSVFLFSLFSPVAAFNLNIWLHFSLAGIFTYLYMRQLQASALPALFSGVAYMFCGMLVHWADNVIVHNASIWLPLILFFLEKIKKEKKFIYVVGGCFSFAALIFAGHPQILTYTAMVVLFYVAYMTAIAQTDRRTIFSYGTLILVLGGLLGSVQLVPTKELADLSIRTRITPDLPLASFLSFKLMYLITFLFPYFFGSPNPGFYPVDYSGIKFIFEGIGYTGILPLLLTVTALLIKKDGHHIVSFWVFILSLAFLLAMGTNTPLIRITCHVPLLNSFYNHTMHIFELDFAIAILGGLGLECLLSGRTKQIRKRVAVFLSAALLLLAAGGLISFDKAVNGEMGNRLREKLGEILVMSNPAIYMPIIFMIASGIIVWFLCIRPRNKIGQGILVVILFSDLFFFGHFLHHHSIKVDAFIQKDKYLPVITFLQETESDPNSYRVFPVISYLSEIASYDFVFSNNNILYPISSVAGYDPLYLKDHLTLFNARKNGTFQDPLALAGTNRIISLLNARYLIVNPQHAAAIESMQARTSVNDTVLPLFWGDLKTEEHAKDAVPLYERVFNSPSGTCILKNRNVLPRAYLVPQIRPVENFDEAYTIMWDEKDPFNPRQEALVQFHESKPPAELTGGKATIMRYRPREVVIETESIGQSFLVLSDTCYPGWKAFIDERETPIYKTNGIVRGVFVEPGTHTVRFIYSPISFKIGTITSLATLVMLLAACILMVRSSSGTPGIGRRWSIRTVHR
jgi:hypothetical protein